MINYIEIDIDTFIKYCFLQQLTLLFATLIKQVYFLHSKRNQQPFWF
ncbi:hypothetical protein BH10BAC3_BH10BAC3_17360 [soil metagenome]